MDTQETEQGTIPAVVENSTSRKYKKHDWDRIRFLYESGEMSLRELAEQEEIFPTLLFKRSAAEGWNKGREKFGNELVASVRESAKQRGVSSALMIIETARIALEEWKQNDKPVTLGELRGILELAARVEGLEIDKRTLTVKDWRDVASADGKDADDIQTFADKKAVEYFGLDEQEADENTAGWTD